MPLQFYKNSGGNEPVREWLKTLDEPDRHTFGQDLMRAQWRWQVWVWHWASLWAVG
jgi:hypothetical protein